MPMSVVYTTINGRIVQENRGGVERYYMSDTNGNTIGLMDTSGNVTDTFTYWPYGELQSHVGTSETPFMFGGILGCYTDSWGGIYMRAREFRPTLARWQTVDPLWPHTMPYGYADNNPVTYVDPNGLQIRKGTWYVFDSSGPCDNCAGMIILKWWQTGIHHSDHQFTHCMACCMLTALAGADCAQSSQFAQNFIDAFIPPFGQGRKGINRYSFCGQGIAIGLGPIKPPYSNYGYCSSECGKLYPPPSILKPLPDIPACDPTNWQRIGDGMQCYTQP